METQGPSDGVVTPALMGRSEDSDILTAVVGFESLYDVPFVTVNMINGQIEAEVILSRTCPDVSLDRIRTAMTVGRDHGQRAYARVFGDLYEDSKAVRILFTNDPDKGLIWGLLDELGGEWLQ